MFSWGEEDSCGVSDEDSLLSSERAGAEETEMAGEETSSSDDERTTPARIAAVTISKTVMMIAKTLMPLFPLRGGSPPSSELPSTPDGS